jgi:hypothetical protein
MRCLLYSTYYQQPTVVYESHHHLVLYKAHHHFVLYEAHRHLLFEGQHYHVDKESDESIEKSTQAC